MMSFKTVIERLLTIFPEFTCDERELNSWSVTLRHQTVSHAAIFVKEYKGKLEFVPVWPRWHGNIYRPDGVDLVVKVSQGRTDEAIHRDVERRLLAPYYDHLPQQIALMKEHQGDADSKRARIREICELLGIKEPSDDTECLYPYCHGIREIRFNTDGSAMSIETSSLETDVMTEVLKLFKQLVPEKR